MGKLMVAVGFAVMLLAGSAAPAQEARYSKKALECYISNLDKAHSDKAAQILLMVCDLLHPK